MPTGSKAKQQVRGRDGRFAKSAASGGSMPLTVKVTSSGSTNPLNAAVSGLVINKLKKSASRFTTTSSGKKRTVTPTGGIRG